MLKSFLIYKYMNPVVECLTFLFLGFIQISPPSYFLASMASSTRFSLRQQISATSWNRLGHNVLTLLFLTILLGLNPSKDFTITTKLCFLCANIMFAFLLISYFLFIFSFALLFKFCKEFLKVVSTLKDNLSSKERWKFCGHFS